MHMCILSTRFHHTPSVERIEEEIINREIVIFSIPLLKNNLYRLIMSVTIRKRDYSSFLLIRTSFLFIFFHLQRLVRTLLKVEIDF